MPSYIKRIIAACTPGPKIVPTTAQGLLTYFGIAVPVSTLAKT